MSWNYYGFRPYVSIAERQRNAQRELVKLAKKGLVARPIKIEGRTIARSFWGQAWCDNLEAYMDYATASPAGAPTSAMARSSISRSNRAESKPWSVAPN